MVDRDKNKDSGGPTAPAGQGPQDNAKRWRQVQDLLLGEHQEAVERRMHEVSAQMVSESDRVSGLIVELERKYTTIQNDLATEVARRENLAIELADLAKACVHRKDLANKLRQLAQAMENEGA